MSVLWWSIFSPHIFRKSSWHAIFVCFLIQWFSTNVLGNDPISLSSNENSFTSVTKCRHEQVATEMERDWKSHRGARKVDMDQNAGWEFCHSASCSEKFFKVINWLWRQANRWLTSEWLAREVIWTQNLWGRRTHHKVTQKVYPVGVCAVVPWNTKCSVTMFKTQNVKKIGGVFNKGKDHPLIVYLI